MKRIKYDRYINLVLKRMYEKYQIGKTIINKKELSDIVKSTYTLDNVLEILENNGLITVKIEYPGRKEFIIQLTEEGVSVAGKLPQISDEPHYNYEVAQQTQFLKEKLNRIKNSETTQLMYQTASAPDNTDKKEINISVCLTISEKDLYKIPDLLRIIKDWSDGKIKY
jgi:DNA-binding PadR family transcriptional regulator